MIQLHSVVAFFRNVKWTELAITREIHRALGENLPDIPRSVNLFGCLLYQRKKTDIPVAPKSEGHFMFDNWIDLWLPEELFLSVRQMTKK
jgi:hypothetical protein